MMSKFKILSVAFVCGLFFGCKGKVNDPLAPPPGSTEAGGYFCCDASGDNCVYSPDGDCELPVQWCEQIGRLEDGTVICEEW